MEQILEKMRGNVPQFIMKLYLILEKPQYENYISWFNDNQIVIKNSKKLQQKVLPCFFRHKHTASFIRQLNMYKFSKVIKLAKQKNHLYFKNQHFKRGNIQEMYKIKRNNQKKKQISHDQLMSHNQICQQYQQYQLIAYRKNVGNLVHQMTNIMVQLTIRSDLLNKQLQTARKTCQKLMEIEQKSGIQSQFRSTHSLGSKKNQFFSFKDVIAPKIQSLQFFPSQCSIEHAI